MIRPPPRHLGPLRLLVFSVIATALGLGAIEGSARLLGVQGQPDRTTTWFYDHLLSPPFAELRRSSDGRRTWVVPHAASHFTPFPPQRPEKAVRIAVLGGSAAHGYGVFEPAAWPHRLEQILQDQVGDRAIEVVNFGTIAWSSQQMLWAARQIGAWGPWDLIIVYEGHNELLELSAWKSYLPPDEHRSLMRSLRWNQRLEGLRTFAWVRAALVRVGASRVLDPSAEFARRAIGEGEDPAPNDPIPARKTPAMKMLPKEARARIGPEERAYAAATWRHNVGKIVDLARAQGTPTLLVSPPLNDFQDPNWFPRTGPDGARFAALVEEATALRTTSRAREAEPLIDQALAIFPDPRAEFVKAGVLIDLGRRKEARVWFDLARANAEYPNRVVPEVSAVIREFAGRTGVIAVVDAEGELRRLDPDGLLEYRLIYDHCHPSIEGTWRIAGLVAKSILGVGLERLPARPDAGPAVEAFLSARWEAPMRRAEDDERVWETSGLDYQEHPPRYVADFQGDWRLFRLRWEDAAASLDASARDLTMAGVVRFLGSDIDGAETAWKLALEIDPAHCVAWANLARLGFELGDWRAAAEDQQKAVECDPSDADGARFMELLGRLQEG